MLSGATMLPKLILLGRAGKVAVLMRRSDLGGEAGRELADVSASGLSRRMVGRGGGGIARDGDAMGGVGRGAPNILSDRLTRVLTVSFVGETPTFGLRPLTGFFGTGFFSISPGEPGSVPRLFFLVRGFFAVAERAFSSSSLLTASLLLPSFRRPTLSWTDAALKLGARFTLVFRVLV